MEKFSVIPIFRKNFNIVPVGDVNDYVLITYKIAICKNGRGNLSFPEVDVREREFMK
ncbi:MAG: hypothetical protein Kow0098_23220 [Ignavibacteriaceae bacterium]